LTKPEISGINIAGMENNIEKIQNTKELNKVPLAVIPKYYQIKQIILKDIKNNRYPPNAKLPSISVICNDKTGVNYSDKTLGMN